MSRSSSRLTRGLISTPRTSVKMAALAPMPSASVMITINVKPGDLRSWRRANLRSFISFGAQRNHWIDARGAQGGQEACENRDDREEHSHAAVNQRVDWLNRKK